MLNTSIIQSNTIAYFIGPSSPSYQIIYCYSLLSQKAIYHMTKTTPSHFTTIITNYQKSDWTSFKHHIEDFIFYRSHFTNVHKVSMRQTNILSRQYWMLTNSPSLKKIKTAQIALICQGKSASSLSNVITLLNETDHLKSLL